MSNVGAAAPLSVDEATERLQAKWAAIAGFGALLVILGLAALLFSLVATVATVILNGVLFLVAGGAEIGIGMHSRTWGRFFLWLVGGLLYLAAGFLCIVNPVLASAALTLLLGASFVAAGAARLYLTVLLPAGPSKAFVFLSAALTSALGLIIVTHWPSDSLHVIGVLLGVDLLFHGVAWASFGLGLRAHG